MSDNCEVAPLRAHQILKDHLDLRYLPTSSSSDINRTEIHVPSNLIHLDTPNMSLVHESQSALLMNPGTSSLLCEDEHHRDLVGSTATSIPTVDEKDLSRPRNLPSLSSLEVISSLNFQGRPQDPSEENIGSDWLPNNINIPDLSYSDSCDLCEELSCTHDADKAASESDNEEQSLDYLEGASVQAQQTTRISDESQRSTESYCHAKIPNQIVNYVAVDKVAPTPLTMILFGDRVIYDSQKQPGRARTRLSVKRPLNSSGFDDFAKRLKKYSKVTIH
ncbi:uncharacterized protein MELLADRAFT_71583 [Melampsora larici-populina 98AG31]|uniref:Uncharacterized protein n=1 Tax=Melampsora larici-populina (strain 98AG31 / pathotype 3-4-7) TaxID=747676 RepID=F4RI33_MELLP|nr:uncharacterized protein MELLADRAFT_71583 [Melampsora larici-populina 98AG31]EGG07929.1 hypothetical protein MELLADRAFT_71583 [Melampsora larici-populina 98AG31]